MPDHHPISRIQGMIISVSGSTWFSVLEQVKAYHQGSLAEEIQPLTAFITLWGLYHWVCISFELSTAPTEFQRIMERCLLDLRDTIL